MITTAVICVPSSEYVLSAAVCFQLTLCRTGGCWCCTLCCRNLLRYTLQQPSGHASYNTNPSASFVRGPRSGGLRCPHRTTLFLEFLFIYLQNVITAMKSVLIMSETCGRSVSDIHLGLFRRKRNHCWTSRQTLSKTSDGYRDCSMFGYSLQDS